MESGETRHFFTLTGLQIGDLQSYFSRLAVFLAPECNKIFILVDNRPWLVDSNTRPAHLWQLMVTKSRLSPFANTRVRRNQEGGAVVLDLSGGPKSNSSPQKFRRWFQITDVASNQKKALLPVKKLRDSMFWNGELRQTLYGIIVFGIDWAHVRGINYMNELQTDTSLALEAKFMTKWEFDSIAQASNCLSSWFPGTCCDRTLLQEYLDGISCTGEVYYDAEDNPSINVTCGDENMSSEGEDSSYTHGLHKRRKVDNRLNLEADVNVDRGHEESPCVCEMVSSPYCSSTEAIQYSDVLILFRFSDHDLPFRLKQIIMSDTRLLTLLEAGLPSWVIFLQSYPVFCHFYRPWMCPLVRTIYVLMSITTVLIGFYDLYKNVPVLKATAAHLCGPLFLWIENWEMISRIKYLGTMLFLHNFEKAIKWLLMISRYLKSSLLVLTEPMAGPFYELLEVLHPLWQICLQTGESLFSVILVFFYSLWSIVINLGQLFIWPLWVITSLVWWIVTCLVCPILRILKAILITPFRLVAALANLFSFLCTFIFYLLGEIWVLGKGMLQLESISETAAVGASQASMWSSLWSDLFSRVFRAIRSILNGFVAFFAACNRHRLSIYNHMQELFAYSRHRHSQQIVLGHTKGDESQPLAGIH